MGEWNVILIYLPNNFLNLNVGSYEDFDTYQGITDNFEL